MSGAEANQEQDSLAKQIARHQASKIKKKLLKKLGKKAAKLIKQAAIRAIQVLAKVLLSLVSTIGLPEILIAIGVIVAFIIISLSWSYMFGTGTGLNGTDKATYNYIVQQANSTVNMDSSIERPYRVPEKLIAATIQLDVFQKNDDIKSIIENMAQSLSPIFDYGKYDEWNEKQVSVYEDGKLVSSGNVQHTPNLVSKLDNVDYWDGSTSYTYTPHTSNWVSSTEVTHKTIQVPVKQKDKTIVMQDKTVKVDTVTKTRYQYFTHTSSTHSDYSTFDRILNSYGLGLNDKKLIEINYLFMGGQIGYTDWLKNNGGGDLGSIGFNGNIIPGAGVPAQFMPFYLGAEKKYGVKWEVLAAIHFVETGFSSNSTMISSVGAIGPMQFMPATWAGWTYNIGGGLVSASVDISNPTIISAGNGYGVDGDNNGKADPWNDCDAIYTAAHYLSKNGFANDPRAAIYQYNHAEWYVNKVLNKAEEFKNAATYQLGSGSIPALAPGKFMRPANGPVSSPFGMRGNSMHFGLDIAPGGQTTIPVVASADGVISKSYLSSSYGNVVFIKSVIDGQQFEAVYAHMENRAVSVGQIVKQGQYLGNMGYTGDVSPPGPGGKHLHFEIHKDSWNQNKTNAINPALVIQF